MTAMMPRRRWLTLTTAAVAGLAGGRVGRALAAPTELKLPDGVAQTVFDFETKGIDGWTTVAGQWAVED